VVGAVIEQDGAPIGIEPAGQRAVLDPRQLRPADCGLGRRRRGSRGAGGAMRSAWGPGDNERGKVRRDEAGMGPAGPNNGWGL
jgi:hypothetical protein